MNFKYLSYIIKGETDKQEYTTYSLDSCLGGKNSIGYKFERPHSKYKISFPREVNKYTYEDYIRDFTEILHTNGHKSSEKIIHVITYIFLNHRDKSGVTDRAWKKFYSSMFTRCNLHLEYPMEIEYEPSEVLHLRNYDIGKYDISTIRNKIREETISGYWESYYGGDEENLSKKLSFRRLINGITVLDTTVLVHKKFSNTKECEVISDLYFEALTYQWFISFFAELQDELLDSLVFGGVDFAQLFNLSVSSHELSRIAIFSRIKGYKRNGWIIPISLGIFEFSFDSQYSTSEVNNQLDFYYKSMSHKSDDYYPAIKTYRRLIGNGMRLLCTDNIVEAFMDFWGAMDTIFKRDSDSNALKNRLAATTWYQSGTNHETQYQKVDRLYKIRNKCVHGGFNVDREDAMLMRNICQTVLSVLLNIHNNQELNQRAYKDWILDIDKSWRMFYDKQPVNFELLKGIGVIPEI